MMITAPKLCRFGRMGFYFLPKESKKTGIPFIAPINSCWKTTNHSIPSEEMSLNHPRSRNFSDTFGRNDGTLTKISTMYSLENKLRPQQMEVFEDDFPFLPLYRWFVGSSRSFVRGFPSQPGGFHPLPCARRVRRSGLSLESVGASVVASVGASTGFNFQRLASWWVVRPWSYCWWFRNLIPNNPTTLWMVLKTL